MFNLVPPKISGLKFDNAQVLLNRPLNLECPVDSYPPSTITWFKVHRTFDDIVVKLTNLKEFIHRTIFP